MSKYHPAFTKRLSLDSNSFKHRVATDSQGSSAENPSAPKDIFRYSYNLGIQRTTKIQRASSIGGNFIQPMDNNLAKVLLERRGLPRSLSMEAQIGRVPTSDSPLENTNHQHLNVQVSVKSDSQENTETLHDNNTVLSSINENNSTLKGKCEETKESNANGNKENPEHRAKKLHNLSDSVPDLRATEHIRLQREGFTGLFNETDLNQSKPICKLRRAARRLGVSLSTDELYHKERRGGVCTEIDDAAENRKLLRVLNKRF